MTAKGDVRKVLGGAFRAASMLTGSSEVAESAVLDGIAALESENNVDDVLLLETVKSAIQRRIDFPGQSEQAPSHLPRELQRFPRARLVATPDVVKVMRQQASPPSLTSFWNPRFPGQISDHLVIAEELPGNVIDPEGRDLVAVPLGHTDTENTTCLHVPSIGLVVVGDAAYNGVHLHLNESNPQTRREWIAALDTIEALKPTAVIAGHKRPENDDSPRIIEETRQYIRDFERVAGTTTARALFDSMLEV